MKIKPHKKRTAEYICDNKYDSYSGNSGEVILKKGDEYVVITDVVKAYSEPIINLFIKTGQCWAFCFSNDGIPDDKFDWERPFINGRVY